MQIVSNEDNLHEMAKPVSCEKNKLFQNIVCWEFYPEC